MSESVFHSDVRVKGALTVTGAITGNVGGTSVAVGTATLTDEGPGTLTSDLPFACASPLTIGTLTLTDDTTVLTCSAGLQASGPVFGTSYASVTYLIETLGVAAVSQAAYELAAGVRTVTLTSTGAGGPFAIDLSTNNAASHQVTFVMIAYDTSAFTCACLQGTVTFDAVGESATFRYLGGGVWTIVALQGATVA